jgi:N-acetylmuramoyl-L-alanine amidase
MEKQIKTQEVSIVDKTQAMSVMSINEYNLQIKYGITGEELDLLERIVQAEAGGEDLKGKILVANVILNRVHSSRFPNDIKSVIMAGRQFSPVSDGRLWTVTVSAETKEAVQRALDGEDYSQGALYFMARSAADPGNVTWFDRALTRLFRHGGHEFFK